MTQLYEAMFLLENDLVRQDWAAAKSLVTDLLEKNGAKVVTARRWAEQRLAYPIRRRRRATYLLCHFEAPGDSLAPMRRDLDIRESVLRYLFLKVEAVPEGETALSEAERSPDFAFPEPPRDDAPEVMADEGAEREPQDEEASDEEVETSEDEGGEPEELEKRVRRPEPVSTSGATVTNDQES